MEFKKYIRSLLPSFEKARVMEDIRLMREELLSNTLPPYENAARAFGKRKFEAKQIQDFEKEFSKAVKTKVRGNFIAVSAEALKEAKASLDVLEQLADEYYAEDIFKNGLTFLKANLLQYLEAISFAMRYSRKLLLWTYASETNVLENNTDKIGQELNGPERDWLGKHAETYFRVINILLTNNPKGIEKALTEIPDIVIEENNVDVVKRTVGMTKLDPFRLGLIPLAINPIYHVRMAIADWQVARVKAAQEEKRVLEYRLLHLKELDKGNTADAKLQENIEYTESRLEKLNYRLAKLEDKYG